MTATLVFTCSICGEPSQSICSFCTKDACANHLCERCGRCSDCCECEVRLDEPSEHTADTLVVATETEAILVEAVPVEIVIVDDGAAAPPDLPQPAAQQSGETVNLFAPEPPESSMAEPVSDLADDVQPDLSKLFAPEPDTPSLVVPPPTGPSVEPDLSKLFAPEPDASVAPPPTGPTGDPDLSKLFAPEPDVKPVAPAFPSGAEPSEAEDIENQDETPEPDEASGDPT